MEKEFLKSYELWVKSEYIDSEDREELIDAVRITVASIITLLENNTNKKQNAHRQCQAQRENFDDIAAAPTEQCLNYIVYLLHTFIRF